MSAAQQKAYYIKKFNIPDNAYAVKGLVALKDCPVKLGTLKSIIAFTGLSSVYEIEKSNGVVCKYYNKDDCFKICRDFLVAHPDTKSFFLQYKASLQSAEEKQNARAKAKKTMLERYGQDNPSKLKEIQDKKRLNFIKSHGESFSDYMTKKSVATAEQRKQTNIQRYGEEYAKLFNKHAQESLLKRHGKDAYKEIHEQGKATMLKLYGVSNPAQIESAKKKTAETRKKHLSEIDSKINELGGVSFQQIYTKFNLYSTAIYTLVERYSIKINYFYRRPYLLKSDYVKLEPNLIYLSKITGSHGSSAEEQQLFDFIKTVYSGPIIRNTRSIIPPLELDFYFPEANVAIELNGLYWHSDQQKTKDYHINKSKACEAIGIRLIHIYDSEWHDYDSCLKIKSLVCEALHVTKDRVLAEQCRIKCIARAAALTFLNNNSLQSYPDCELAYGLFYNNELVQVLACRKIKCGPESNLPNAWEIVGNCTKLNTEVAEGLPKLYNQFLAAVKPNLVVSYCDFNKFDGKCYEQIGMQFAGYGKPDMKWIVNESKYHYILMVRRPKANSTTKTYSGLRLFGAGSKKFMISYNNKEDKEFKCDMQKLSN